MTEPVPHYPVRVDAAAQPAASRALWLVKWLLLVPHFIVLIALWTVFVLFTIAAFFAIVFTGRFPRVLFDFNVGVLRWSWRVHYYGYAALGTDRYPPFTLADVPDYPAHLEIPYPARLSRGLVLVKWWLLALPHYLVVAVFAGGGLWFTGSRHAGNPGWNALWGAGGLVGLLVLVSAIVLLFAGRYPKSLYEFVIGMDRWVLRVAAYAGLMTDAYPPFRLDMGGPDPASARISPITPWPLQPGAQGAPVAPTPAVHGDKGGWTGGRIVSVVAGALMLFVATGAVTAGGGMLWARHALSDDGFVSTSPMTVSSAGHAITSPPITLRGTGVDWFADHVIGTVRLSASSATQDGTEVFIGIGPTHAVKDYLRGVGHTEINRMFAWWDGRPTVRATSVYRPGGPPGSPPADARIWAASATGPGTPAVTWRPDRGDWTIVVMHADATPGITAHMQAAATVPALRWIGAGLLTAGLVLLAGGGLAIGLATGRAARATTVDTAPA